jgi:hypothetical protein
MAHSRRHALAVPAVMRLTLSIAVVCELGCSNGGALGGTNVSDRSCLFRVHAQTETGAVVQGADVFLGASLVARTDENGVAAVDVPGASDATFYVRVDCPTLYRSPQATLRIGAVKAVQTAGVARREDFDVICQELRHAPVVVAFDEEGDEPLPSLGKELARVEVNFLDVPDHDDAL